jgi:phage I-like protein
MQYVLVVEDGKVKDVYEFHPEQGFMVRKEEWTGAAMAEIEDKLKTQFESVKKLREAGDEIVYEVK